MNCNDAREAMLSRLDGADDSLDRHLEDCPACARAWQALASAWETRAELRAPRAPAGMQDRVLARLEENRVFAPRPLRADVFMWLGRGLAAATVVCYGILALMLVWPLATQKPLASNALAPSVARAWSRLPDPRGTEWLRDEMGPDEAPAGGSQTRHRGGVVADERAATDRACRRRGSVCGPLAWRKGGEWQ